MQKYLMIDKLKAAGVHLFLSIFLALLSLAIVYLVWYPQPLAKATDVNSIFLMMLAIDVLLGPMLTFIVFKKGKKTLKSDLIIIVILQLSALSYGLYSISQARPAWVVYTIDRFELVQNNQIIQENITQAKPIFQKSSWLGVEWVAVEKAKNIEKNRKDILQESMSGISLSQYPENYMPLSNVVGQMVMKAEALNVLEQFNDQKYVDEILSKYPQANAWLPLRANALDMVVLINKDQGEIVKIVDLRPWN